MEDKPVHELLRHAKRRLSQLSDMEAARLSSQAGDGEGPEGEGEGEGGDNWGEDGDEREDSDEGEGEDELGDNWKEELSDLLDALQDRIALESREDYTEVNSELLRKSDELEIAQQQLAAAHREMGRLEAEAAMHKQRAEELQERLERVQQQQARERSDGGGLVGGDYATAKRVRQLEEDNLRLHKLNEKARLDAERLKEDLRQANEERASLHQQCKRQQAYIQSVQSAKQPQLPSQPQRPKQSQIFVHPPPVQATTPPPAAPPTRPPAQPVHTAGPQRTGSAVGPDKQRPSPQPHPNVEGGGWEGFGGQSTGAGAWVSFGQSPQQKAQGKAPQQQAQGKAPLPGVNADLLDAFGLKP